jgi:hypothetical protein
MSATLHEKADRWCWFAVYLRDDAASARLRQVARREGYRTMQAEHADGPTTLLVGSKGRVAGQEMIALLALAGVTGACVAVDE